MKGPEFGRPTGVDWDKRSYKVEDFESSDPANQALTAATTCLYGVVHSVIAALGLSPGLGFVHTGHDRSLVYDVADLYKTSLAVPVAFECAANGDVDDIPGATRRAMRDAIHESKLLSRCVEDIHTLLDAPGDPDDGYGWDVVDLWDDRVGTVASGRSWA